MNRKLDVAIVEALGHKVSSNNHAMDYFYPGENNKICMVPPYSTYKESALNLVEELIHERGWKVVLNISERNVITSIITEDDCIVRHGDTIPGSISKAVYKALTGKEWEGEK